MESIKEVIVVEGKNDMFKIQQVFDCDCFITYGYRITPRKLMLLQQLQTQRGLILFLDPDTVGEKIRKKISNKIEGCQHAYIAKHKARTAKKVGIEHASDEEIYQALKHRITKQKIDKESITREELIAMQLTNDPEAKNRRKMISDYFYLGNCNFKTLYKRLNLLQIDAQTIKKILE